MKNIPALTGLRAVAVAAVVGLHSGVGAFQGGALGVDVFFVLSGFLITSLLLDEFDGTSRLDLRAFMVRRLRRLAPALLAMVLVVLAFAAVAPLALSPEFAFPGIARAAAAAATYTMDIATVNGLVAGPFLHTWSLGVEMQFYLFWPLVLLAALKLGARTRTLLLIALAGILATVAWRYWLLGHASSWHILYAPDAQCDELLAGAAVAILYRAGLLPSRLLAFAAPAGLLVLLALVVHALSVAQLTHFGYVLIWLSAAAVIGHLATERPGLLRRLLSLPLVVYVGEISYSIYLWHFPIFQALTAHALGVPRVASIVLRLGLTLALAVLSYHTVEQRFRRRRSADTPVPARAAEPADAEPLPV